jgi:hypothetical protein
MPVSTARSFLLFLLLAALLPADAKADETEQEVRILKLTDGRLLTGRILGADAKGMEIEVPQGLITVPYTSLAEVEVTEASEYEEQAPLRVAVAPTGFGNPSDKALARDVDLWLADLVALVPWTDVLSAKQWAQALADRGTELHTCSGDIDCIRLLAEGLGLDRILIASLTGGLSGTRTLRIRTVVASSGSVLRPAFPKVRIAGGRSVPSADSPALLDGVFTALGFTPAVDGSALAQAAFPPPDLEVLVERGGATTPGLVPAPAPPPPSLSIATKELKARPLGSKGTGLPLLQISQGQAVAMAFLPVPGLASALGGDRRGFVFSLIGTVALSWVTVYTMGRFAHSPESFWLPSVLGSYAICVGLGQLSLAIARGPGKRPRIRRKGVTATIPRATIAPLLSRTNSSRGKPSGASLLLSGSF